MAMGQQLLIGVIVLLAAAYVVWSVLSLPRRQGLLDALARRGWCVQLALRHRARLALPGCGKCAQSASHRAARR